MASGYADGTVVVDTELDTTGFDGGSKRMEAAIRSLVSKVNNLGPSFQRALGGSEGAVASFQAHAAALREQIAATQQKLADFGNRHIETQEYTQLKEEIEKAGEALARLDARQDKMVALGVSEESAQWKSLQYDLDLANEKYSALIERKRALEASGGAFQTEYDTAEYSQMVSDLGTAQQQLADMETRIEAVADGAGNANNHIGGMVGAAKQFADALTQAARTIGGYILASAKSVASHLLKAAKTVGGKLLSGVKSAASHMAKLLVPSVTQNQISGLTSSMKRFALSMLGARGVYALLRKAVSAYMQENQALSNTLSSCWSGIGNLLGPIITRIINLVASAVAWVTAFFKLFGIVGKSATKAIGAAGGAAGKQVKELKKQLASFDELNILSDNGSDSGGGGGGGGAGAAALPEVQLPDWAKLMAEQIKAGNWGAAAVTLSTALNDMVNSVRWRDIGTKLGKGLDGALTFLATFIKTFDWLNLGASLAELVNGVLNTVDWGNLGTILSAKFRILLLTAAGFLLNLDWSALASGFTDFAVNFFNGITEAIAAVDWYQLGKDVAQFIKEVDWNQVFDAFCEAVGAALGGLAAFLWGLIEEAWNSVVEWWNEVAYEDGEFTIEGLLNGIVDALANIGNWILEHVWEPLKEGFCNAFGIHSPSTKMQELGDFLIQGLLEGITQTWSNIKEWFSDAWEGIKQTTSEAWDKVKEKVSGAWSSVKETVTTVGSNIKEKVSDTWSNVKESVKSKLESARDTAKSAWDSIKSTVSSSGSNIGSTVTDAWETVKRSVTSRMKSAQDASASGWNSMKSAVSTAAKTISSDVSAKFKDVYKSISDKVSNAKDTVSVGFAKIKSSITDNVSGAMNALKSIDWGSVGSNIVSGIGNGLSNSWKWLKDKAKNLANNLLSSVKDVLKISSPSKLFRDEVGWFIGLGIGEGIDRSKKSVLSTVSSMASAIAGEFQGGSYSFSAVDDAMGGFGDRITSGLDRLMDQLQAIADRVTFVVPAPALGSITPPGVLASAEQSGQDLRKLIEEVDDDLAGVIASAVSSATVTLVDAIRDAGKRPVKIDKKALTESVLSDIERNQKMFGYVPA